MTWRLDITPLFALIIETFSSQEFIEYCKANHQKANFQVDLMKDTMQKQNKDNDHIYTTFLNFFFHSQYPYIVYFHSVKIIWSICSSFLFFTGSLTRFLLLPFSRYLHPKMAEAAANTIHRTRNISFLNAPHGNFILMQCYMYAFVLVNCLLISTMTWVTWKENYSFFMLTAIHSTLWIL